MPKERLATTGVSATKEIDMYETKGVINPDPWKHRLDGMRCKTCIWFVPKTNQLLGDASEIGRCRRHAPTMGGYPVVYVTDWCGDHRLDENKV
jgi:hypothetical protein